jgi:hypothetical protein
MAKKKVVIPNAQKQEKAFPKDHFFSKANQKRLRKSIKQLEENGGNLSELIE